jgi:hypothetical protein
MALNDLLILQQNIDGLTAVITDATPDYGVGGNPARADRANYLLYSHNDTKANRTYYNITTSLPLSQMTWTVPTDIVGWTSATLLRISKWTNNPYVNEEKDGQGIITTYANIVYYTPTNKVYKCIQDHTNIAPDAFNGNQYWTEVSDLSTLIGYETVEQYTQNFQIDIKINTCVTKGFLNNCGCSKSLSDIEPALKNWALYMSATANFNNGAPEKMEAIMENLDKICNTCC